jgi:uncharacterized tellurite resistance protein B-like protein
MGILDFLGLKKTEVAATAAPASPETETVRKIVARLDAMDPEQARYVAAFAFILSRVAHADLNISEQETAAMERIVMERGGLPEEQAVLVVQMAKTQSRLFGGTENFLVTREFTRLATPEQKLALLDCLFAVSAADLSVSSAEEVEIKKIVTELKLSHDDYIAARLRYRDYLAVLKKTDVRK